MMNTSLDDPLPNALPLLGPDDPPPFTVHNPHGQAPVLVLVDHASNTLPAALGDLGLTEAERARHIAYDIGIAEVSRRLAALLDAPALLHSYSRLMLDPNRGPDDPTQIPAISDGAIVPGNKKLTFEQRADRLAVSFYPYHDAIAAQLEGFHHRGVVPAILSMHSFTPAMRDGRPRPWEVGILWGDDPRIPVPLMKNLTAAGWAVGDNEPYSGRNAHGYTVDMHALARGLPHVLIELRQDLIAEAEGQGLWAERMASALRPILADPSIYSAKDVASW
jgi:predicted N-formylglutamate amidohydrolase